MNAGPYRRWLNALCGLGGLCCAGCHDGDVDRLARVWHRLGCRVKDWTGGARQKVSNGWSAMEMQINSPAVICDRVRTRLSLDKGLANAAIEVEVESDVVTLRGDAPDLASRRRAVELAEGTIGVGQVVDELGPKE
jgi:hypothetical protein